LIKIDFHGRNCRYCGQQLVLKPSNASVIKYFFCSQDCMGRGTKNPVGIEKDIETKRPPGEKVHWSLLKKEDIPEIRRQIAAGIPLPVIAEQYGVKPSTINNVKHKISWSHVTED